MKRLMIFAVAAVGAALASCSKSELQVPENNGKPNALPVRVSLTPEALSGSFGPVSEASLTKTAAAKGDGMEVTYGEADTKSTKELTTAEDSKVYNVWAIQFKADGTLLGTPYYTEVTSPAGAGTPGSIDATYDLSVNLTTNTETGGKVYFIANTNSPSAFNATNAATEAKLKAAVQGIGTELKPTAGGGVQMLGVYTGAVSSSTAITAVKMKRLVAKVILKYKVDPAFADFTVTSVQLRNVPANIYYTSEPTGTFPAKATGSHKDYPAENLSTAATDGAYKKFVWYMPENLRGVKSGVTDAGDRTLDKTDGCATYIEIKGTVNSLVSPYKNVVYSILLGDAATNKGDFNVKRNNVYTVTVNIQGANTSDNRITVESFDMNNCGMIVPNSGVAGAVTFDIRKLTKGWKTTMPALGSSAALRAEILWQDGNVINAGDVSLDKTKGLLTVKSSKATEGNAVVALYDAATGGNILWSWHIWVTDYHPDGSKAYGLGANSKASVTGGEVHTYGTKFIAKNPGKVMMDRNLGATKTYYAAPDSADATAQEAFGMFYQWGRKDPFPRSTCATVKAVAPTTIPIYAADGTTVLTENGTGYRKVNITEAGVINGGNTLAYSVKNPLSFLYKTAEPWDWYTDVVANKNDALWGDGAAKSAYDPCPKGWRVAPNGTWSDFTRTDTNAGTFLFYAQGKQQEVGEYLTGGRYYKPASGDVRAWYPAPGFLDGGFHNKFGVLVGVGSEGSVWSSTVTSSAAYYMRLVSNSVAESGGRRMPGFLVRCIQD